MIGTGIGNGLKSLFDIEEDGRDIYYTSYQFVCSACNHKWKK